MLDTKSLRQTVQVTIPYTEHGGLNRLLVAAAVNPSFCRLLLENSLQAVQTGFQGESFSLTAKESLLLFSVHAHTLTELAQQLACAFSQQPQPILQIPASPFDLSE